MRAVRLDRSSPCTHEQARAVRDEVFGRRLFVRGVVEVSSYCRQNCYYCAMRRDNYPIYKRERVIMDEERVLSAIAEASCELSRVGIAEHLKNTLATERVSRSSEATSRAFEAARSDTRL